jgi:hypothetical protein
MMARCASDLCYQDAALDSEFCAYHWKLSAGLLERSPRPGGRLQVTTPEMRRLQNKRFQRAKRQAVRQG